MSSSESGAGPIPPETQGKPMTTAADHPFTRLLLATEHSDQDAGAERVALAMSRRCGLPLQAVLPLAFNAEFESVAPELAARADAQAAERRAALQALAVQAGVDCTIHVRRAAELHEAIVDTARALGSELIVTRRRGRRGVLANLLVGEMVSRVVAHAPCSVLLTPAQGAMWSRRICCGVDPAAPSMGVVEQAARVAATCGLPLDLVAVVPSLAQRDAADAVMAGAGQRARALGAQVETQVCVGRVHDALLQAAAAAQADLLVIGRHGGQALGTLQGLARAWLGGAAQKIIGLATSPVLVVVETEPKADAHTGAQAGAHR